MTADGAGPGQEQLMRLGRSDTAGCAVVTVDGEVESLTVPRLVGAVRAALAEPSAAPVVVDLSGVTFLASSGLGALLEIRTETERRGRPLRLVVDHTRPVVRPLRITGLEQTLDLYHTIEDAVAHEE